jgi:hypothetical protein
MTSALLLVGKVKKYIFKKGKKVSAILQKNNKDKKSYISANRSLSSGQ